MDHIMLNQIKSQKKIDALGQPAIFNQYWPRDLTTHSGTSRMVKSDVTWGQYIALLKQVMKKDLTEKLLIEKLQPNKI